MSSKLGFLGVLVSMLLFGMTTAQAVTVEISSPQEGTEVQPGGTVELTVTVTNDAAIKDCVIVTLKLTVEGIQHPVVTRGYLRLKQMEPGESVTRTVALTVPADIQLDGPKAATVDATASGKKTQTQDTDSLGFTLVPMPQ